MPFFEHPWLNPDAIEARAYQDRILKTALRGNTLVVLPTGTGKTAIAALVAAHRFEKFPDAKVLMVAPTKPLARQHRDSFEKFMKIGQDELRVVTGAIKPEERAAEYKSAWAVFATPQTIERDLKRNVLSLKNFSLLIVDESHRSIGNYAYTAIARRYISEAANPLILGLTASPGSNAAKIAMIKKNLYIDLVELRTEADEDISSYVKPTKTHWLKIELTPDFDEIQNLLRSALERRLRFLLKFGQIRGLRVGKKVLLDLQRDIMKRAIATQDSLLWQAFSVATQCIKIQHALELAQSQSLVTLRNYFEKIVKANKTKSVRAILADEEIKKAVVLLEDLLSKNIDHPKFDVLLDVLAKNVGPEKKAIVFTQYVDTVGEIVRRTNAGKLGGDTIKAHAFIGQRRGVSQKKQMEILQNFRDGLFNVLVSTSIGEEGLDIPAVDVVIFYEPIPSDIRSIQRRGRTGRFRPGDIYILMAKETIDEAYYWSAHYKEKRMRRILHGMREITVSGEDGGAADGSTAEGNKVEESTTEGSKVEGSTTEGSTAEEQKSLGEF